MKIIIKTKGGTNFFHVSKEKKGRSFFSFQLLSTVLAAWIRQAQLRIESLCSLSHSEYSEYSPRTIKKNPRSNLTMK